MIIERGSEWNKWDLHYHVFKTHLNCDFREDEAEYLKEINASDIAAYGITDYFTADQQIKIIEDYKKKYPKSRKKLFVNVEFRLDLNVSGQKGGNVNAHIIFDDALSANRIKSFINSLDTTMTNENDVHAKVSELKSEKDFQSATIKIDEIKDHLTNTFGKEKPYLLVFAGSGYGSIRPDTSRRNRNLAVQYDKCADFFFANEKSRNYFLDINNDGKSSPRYEGSIPKASVVGSDYHGDNSQSQLSHYTWIKADLSFSGLSQIMFEPADRVRLESEKPDKKSAYQVIDYVSFSQTVGGKTYLNTIPFNANLNSIIGGRSNGKSTLTNSIAQALKNPRFVSKRPGEVDGMYTFDSEDFQVHWKDNEISDSREVEFLPQDFMIKIAEHENTRNNLVEKIMAKNASKYQFVQDYKKSIENNRRKINELLGERKERIDALSNQVKPEGDKAGVLKEIDNLRGKIKEQEAANKVSNTIAEQYKHADSEIKDNREQERIVTANLEELNNISEQSVINIPQIPSLEDHEFENLLRQEFNKFKDESNTKWHSINQKLIDKQNEKKRDLQNNINRIESSEDFIKGKSLMLKLQELHNLNAQLDQEQQNLDAITRFNKLQSEEQQKILQINQEIKKNFLNYKTFRDDFQSKFIESPNSEIKIAIKFHPNTFESKIDYLNGRNQTNNQFIDDFNQNPENQANRLFEINNLSFNRHKSMNDLISDVFSNVWYSFSYSLKYEEDEFSEMSQGKKAFVILTLILDFSKDKKPVIIDQPEDSLDNRSIYVELTKYLKRTKRERQIILVTHNPNVVVGADTENVIVANQNSSETPNLNKIRFDYVNGPLENSFKKKSSCFLGKKGIREHVIEILEGGDAAFEIREHKYNLGR